MSPIAYNDASTRFHAPGCCYTGGSYREEEPKDVAESRGLTQEGQDIPFEELERMRQHGGITKQELQKVIERAKAKSFKRENKNRPMEMSSKRPVPRLREVVEGTKRYAAPQMSVGHPALPLGISAVPSHA